MLEEFTPSADNLNRLFFSARNLAIEAMLRGLEVELLRQGYPAECEWHEVSRGGPTVSISMLNTSGKADSWEKGTCSLQVKRTQERAPEYFSNCIYVADSFSASEYWPRKQPAKLLAFREAVQALWDCGELQRRILRVNFPFDYDSHSSF